MPRTFNENKDDSDGKKETSKRALEARDLKSCKNMMGNRSKELKMLFLEGALPALTTVLYFFRYEIHTYIP